MRFAAVGALLCLVAGPVNASVIDYTVPTGYIGLAIDAYEPLAQSFKANGTKIKSVGFSFFPINSGLQIDPIQIDLYEGDGISGALWASRTVDLGVGDGVIDIDFDFPALTFTPGSQYTLALSVGGSSAIPLYQGVRIHTKDVYADGRLSSPAPYLFEPCVSGGCDLAFRVSMTDAVASVPELASWVQMIFGLALVGFAVRLRRPLACSSGSMR